MRRRPARSASHNADPHRLHRLLQTARALIWQQVSLVGHRGHSAPAAHVGRMRARSLDNDAFQRPAGCDCRQHVSRGDVRGGHDASWPALHASHCSGVAASASQHPTPCGGRLTSRPSFCERTTRSSPLNQRCVRRGSYGSCSGEKHELAASQALNSSSIGDEAKPEAPLVLLNPD